MSEKSDFIEDEAILARLDNEADIEAFANLMAHAHDLGMSAADFVREEPKRTSRKRIRQLCLANQKRSLRMLVKSVLKSLWDRPAHDPAEALAQSLYAPPQSPGKPHVNGHARRTSRE